MVHFPYLFVCFNVVVVIIQFILTCPISCTMIYSDEINQIKQSVLRTFHRTGSLRYSSKNYVKKSGLINVFDIEDYIIYLYTCGHVNARNGHGNHIRTSRAPLKVPARPGGLDRARLVATPTRTSRRVRHIGILGEQDSRSVLKCT
jgi:hypothetical protein